MQAQQRIDAALYKYLLDNASIPLVGSGIGGLMVTVSQWDSPNQTLAMGWMLLVFLSIALRHWLVRQSQEQLAANGYVPRAAMRYALTTSISGVVWGLCGVFTLDSSPTGMVVIITAIQAMVMGGALTLGAYLPAFRAYAVPALLPLILILSVRGSTQDIILAAYSAIFLVLVDGIAKRLNASLQHTWQLSFDKDDLVSALSIAHDHQSSLAKTDGLTGIANRRQFDEVLDKEFSRLRRSEAPLSILMLDVDHFKRFNDSFGHLEGDQCLMRIAAVLKSNIARSSDLAARYGGEEFAVILPETDHAGALRLAEHIRTEVAALNIHSWKLPDQNGVTVSLGVVTVQCDRLNTALEALALADRELYRAKQEGRNRVASWQDPVITN